MLRKPGMNPERSEPYYEFLGRAIKVERVARGMDRRVLAERAGISYPYLSEIENGGKRPSSSSLLSIADALGLGPSELMGAAERLMVEQRHRDLPRLQEDAAMPPPSAAAATRSARPAAHSDERSRLVERIRTIVGALDTDDLVRVSDLIDRLRR
jgi:transcriptional regulator with XRE-family HTH domain